MEKIVLFRNSNDIDAARSFLYSVYCICEQVIPKKNCMPILSKPNAGKNMFFDDVVHWYSNYGQVCNFNKYQQFPLMDQSTVGF